MSNKHLNIGPGGKRCNCCFPAPGSKSRKLEFRKAKRKEAKEAEKIEESEADPYNEYYSQWDDGYSK